MIVLYVIVFYLWFYYMWSRRRFLLLARKIRGPDYGLPFIGHGYLFLDATKIVSNISNLVRKYGTPLHFWLGHRFLLILNKPEHVEAVLSSPHCLDKGRLYKYLQPLLGLGLVTSNSSVWKAHRKLLSSSFYVNIIKDFFPIFDKNICNLVERLNKYVDTAEPFDIQEPIKDCTFDLIFKTTMDSDIGESKNSDKKKLLDAVEYAQEVVSVRIFQVWIQPPFLFKLSKYYKPLMDSLHTIRQHMEDILDRKSVEFHKNRNKDVEDNEKKTIFIDRILELYLEKNIFTREELIDEIKTVIMAGYETTATTTSYVLLLLGIYPEIQKHVFEEIRTKLPDRNVAIKPEDLNEMFYLDRVIKEVLRLFPTIPFLTRLSTADIVIDNHVIPAGTEFILTILEMQRTQEYWKNFDSHKFNPDNFLPENMEGKHAYGFVPFSAGPRNCIGMRYASFVLKLIVVKVIQNYIISSDMNIDDFKFRMNITLILLNKHLVKIKRRDTY